MMLLKARENLVQKVITAKGKHGPYQQKVWVKNIDKLRSKIFSIDITKIKPNQSKKYTYEKSGKNPSKSTGPITATLGKNNQLIILDGNHRYYEALERGDKQIYVKITASEEKVSNEQVFNFWKHMDQI